jgi:hypothetical protein
MLYDGTSDIIDYTKIRIIKLHDYYKPYPNFELFTNLYEIELYYTTHKKIPDLSKCNKLTNLYICYSDIDELPLLPTSLKKLHIYNSNITKIPDLSHLINLEDLYIHNNINQNININKSISKLHNLKRLNIILSRYDYDIYKHDIVNMNKLSSIEIKIIEDIPETKNNKYTPNDDFIFAEYIS